MISDYKTILINAGTFGISMTNIDITDLKILLIKHNNRIYCSKMVFTK